MTPTQITASAQAVITIANQLKSAYIIAKEYSGYNSVTDPGWNTLTGAPVDGVTGVIANTEVKPSDVSNAIGSINQFLNYWEGQAVATSAWGQNLQKISSPVV